MSDRFSLFLSSLAMRRMERTIGRDRPRLRTYVWHLSETTFAFRTFFRAKEVNLATSKQYKLEIRRGNGKWSGKRRWRWWKCNEWSASTHLNSDLYRSRRVSIQPCSREGRWDRLGARERFDCPFSVGSYKRKRKKYVFLVIIIDSLREHTMRVAVYDNVTLNRKYKWAWNDTVYF